MTRWLNRLITTGTLVGCWVGPLSAQTAFPDTAGLGDRPYATMRMLFEKTIFKVDVLTLEVRFDPETAARLQALAEGQRLMSALADSIAAVALEATDVFIRLHFERNVSLDQFLDGVRGNTRAARDAGIITPEQYDDLSGSLRVWYDFLAERGIKDGDDMLYRIRGDSLYTMYRTVEGETPLNQVDVGAFRRRSVLGGYFAPRSEFRAKLIASLFGS